MKQRRAEPTASLAPLVIAGLVGGGLSLLLSMTVFSARDQTTSLKMALFGVSGVLGSVAAVCGFCALRARWNQLEDRIQTVEAKVEAPSIQVAQSPQVVTEENLALIRQVPYGVAVRATQTLLQADAMNQMHGDRVGAGYPPLDVSALLAPSEAEVQAAQCFQQEQHELYNPVQQPIPEPARSLGAVPSPVPTPGATYPSESSPGLAPQGFGKVAAGYSNGYSNGHARDTAVGLDHDLSIDAWVIPSIDRNDSDVSNGAVSFD
jgi:hypothetical protein